MKNEYILKDDTFISIYVISMVFLPIFLLSSLATYSFTLDSIDVEVIYMMLFVCVFVILFTFSYFAMSGDSQIIYLTIIAVSFLLVPLISTGYYKKMINFFENIGSFSKLIINIITASLAICVIFLNMISTGSLDYMDAMPNDKNLEVKWSLISLGILVGLYIFVFYVVPSLFAMFFGFEDVNARTSKTVREDPVFLLTRTFFTSIISFFSILFNGITNIGANFYANIMRDINTTEEAQSALFKYAMLYGFIFMIGVILYLSAFDPSTLTGKAYVYALSAIIPLIVIMGFVIPFSTAQRSGTSTMLLIGIVFTIIFGAFYSYSSMNSETLSTVSYAITIILCLIAIIGLAIFFYIFNNYLKSLDGAIGFLVYFIFYIPCLLIDFVNYIFNEFSMTSRPIYFLFIIEILLIMLYFYAPRIIELTTQTSTSGKIVLLKDGAFLNNQDIIGHAYQLRDTDVPNKKKSSVYDNEALDLEPYTHRTWYSISMWVFINAQPPTSAAYAEETNIFDYGNGKPKVTYFNDMSSPNKKNKYIFYFTDKRNGVASYSLTLPNQKWNNFVFNYSSDKVDLFINGNLERTFNFDGNVPSYLATDLVTIGKDNGLDGAICNVVYHTNPMSKTEITATYNLLMMKSPPTLE